MLADLQDPQDLCKTYARPISTRFSALYCGVSTTARPARPKNLKKFKNAIWYGHRCSSAGCSVKRSANKVSAKSLAGLAAPQNTFIPPWVLLQDLGVAEVLQHYEKEAA